MKSYTAVSGLYQSHKFCLITAKADELRDVKSVFDEKFRRLTNEADTLSPAVYLIRERPGHPPFTLLTTCCSAMGHVHAATKTAQIITTYRPRVLLFVGTAASLDPSEVRLGDVVVPTGAVFRLYDKIVEKGQTAYSNAISDNDFKEFFFENNALLCDLQVEPLPGGSNDLISDVKFDGISLLDGDLGKEWRDLLVNFRPPKIETDLQMVTCGMVVNSETFRILLRKKVPRKARVIDMESYGFFKVIADLRQTASAATDGVMIRGISDYAGRKEVTELGPSNWKTISVNNAARVAAEFVTQLANRS